MLRQLAGAEPFFSSPNHQENVLLSIKFTDTKYVKKAVENFKKIFSGLNLSIIGNHYYQKENTKNTIYHIPNWIQDCKQANIWSFENCTLPLDEGLATISCNDSIVVVNSAHNLSDGGFMVSALKHCMDDMLHEKENKSPPKLVTDVFKEEFQQVDDKIDPKDIYPMNKLTSCKYDPNDPHLAEPGTKFIDFDGVIPIEELSCYNKKSKKLEYFTEMQSLAIAVSIAALNINNNFAKFNYDDHLALANVLDMKRFCKNDQWSYGNFVVKPSINAKVSKSDTIEMVCKKFRESIKKLIPYGAIYTCKHVTDFINTPPSSIFGCISSIRPIEFKRPIIDIDLQDCWKSKIGIGDHGKNFGSQFTVVSYSKLSEFRKEFCYFTRFPPSSMTFENGKLLIESFGHFISKIPISASFDDALNELINFQIVLKRKI